MLVGLMAGWLASKSAVDWLDGWLVGRSAGQLVGWSVGWLSGRLVGWLADSHDLTISRQNLDTICCYGGQGSDLIIFSCRQDDYSHIRHRGEGWEPVPWVQGGGGSNIVYW
jgi:hypothetical protein